MFSLFVFAWIMIGLSLAYHDLFMFKSGDPRIMDFMVDNILQEYKKIGKEPSHKDVENWLTIVYTVICIIIWPLMMIQRVR